MRRSSHTDPKQAKRQAKDDFYLVQKRREEAEKKARAAARAAEREKARLEAEERNRRVSSIRLVTTGQVQPSTYNPRLADPERLKLIELSLRKLGFLLQLFADSRGELLSGHQRHYVYSSWMGGRHIPVCFFQRDISLQERKAINIMFNRATNDMDITVTSKTLTEAITQSGVYDLAAALPDRKPDTDEFYPCMHTVKHPLKPILQANSGRWVRYATNITSVLHGKGVIMPIILAPDLTVVNGIGRLEHLAEYGHKEADVLILSEAEANFARIMLNLLTMDFDIKSRYADYLRHNSFRRSRVTPPTVDLGYGFTFVALPQEHPDRFFLTNPEQRRTWERIHGSTILDFGAGRLKETTNLRKAGIDVDYFEPYRIPQGDTIDKEVSVADARVFLQTVATGKEWTSVFLAAILNSVPFREDREHVVRIVAALTGKGKLYATAVSDRTSAWMNYRGRKGLDRTSQSDHGFILDYEPNMKLGDLTRAPKAQKYHSMEEWRELFEAFFEVVETDYYMNQVVTAVCSKPKPIIWPDLKRSLEFEFDLPYPDGARMGLGGEAVAAFARRFGISEEARDG
ncbi:MAG: hypothetical protein KJ077_10605 [Anaerolineae bacterium]|nr:hypothetical protein [Anaerolineae bacterium]